LNKKVLYLDQYFYSHAFRGLNPRFVEATNRIRKLAQNQLVVAPYSNVHEDETHLWLPEKREQLMKFIKQTSGGHHFEPEYQIEITQIASAFGPFLDRASAEPKIDREDALPGDVNEWDDYLFIDVPRPMPDEKTMRRGKEEGIRSLVDLFEGWATRPSTFADDVREELKGARDEYTRAYLRYAEKIARNEVQAMLFEPATSRIVETLMHYDGTTLPWTLRLQRVIAFFDSEYFANVPLEQTQSEFYALLRKRLREGAYRNKEKAQERFAGFFYDVRFIAAYAPYCDAIVVDSLMHDWATDPLIDLPRRYGTRFFSRRNFDEFLGYLNSIAESMPPEVEDALQMIHPKTYKMPDWLKPEKWTPT
jgi:hypothetical protein